MLSSSGVVAISEVGTHFFERREAILVGINGTEDAGLRVLFTSELAVVVFVGGFEGFLDARGSGSAAR